ncbi:MAG: segregation/condensation protein A [Pirellulales bacterium]
MVANDSSASAPDSSVADFAVDLQAYAGPLDLLLFLVRKDELDLTVISLSRIVGQFIEFIDVIQAIDIDGVGEFVETASILIEMKAKLVLPHEGPIEESEEPPIEETSDQLVQRLIQYKRYRDAASLLDEQSRRWQMRYSRLANDLPVRKNDPTEQPIADLEIWDLVSAFGRILRENRVIATSNVIYDETPIHVHMQSIHRRLCHERRIELQSLFPMRAHKSTLVAMFLASLELTRHHGVLAQQEQDGSSIWLVPGPAFQEELDVAEVHSLSNAQIERSNLPSRPR